MIDRMLYDWAPVAIAVVVGAFFADYLLTHLGARASRGVGERWSIEGSYEMNPTWERQIDSGRILGWRVLAVPALVALLLTAVWVFAEGGGLWREPAFFGFAVGSMLLLQGPVLMVHGGNLQTFRLLLDPLAVEGGTRFRRWFVYRQGARYLWQFAILWAALWIPSQQAFFLGGVTSCVLFGRRLAQLGEVAREEAQRPPAKPIQRFGNDPFEASTPNPIAEPADRTAGVSPPGS